jgi:hypothetical protein
VLTVYKKMPFLAILIIGICSLFITSCNQEVSDEKCTLKFSIDANNLLDKSRDITPIGDLALITSYKLILNGPKDESKEISLSDSTGTIKDLSIGYWTIDVEALNSSSKIIATGQSVIYLTNQTNNINIALDKLEGQGNLILSFIWDEEQVVQEQTRVDCTIASDDGTIINKSDYIFQNIGDNDGKSGITLFVDNLSAGSYIISAKLISNDVCISGIVEPIRIINAAESSGIVTFVIGDKANHFTFNIIKNVMLPVSGTIQVSSPQTHINEDFTLTFIADELPIGINENTLTYQWYCEGEFIDGANSNALTTTSTLGSHRYDIIVKNPKMGSTGGTSLTVETINPE